MIRYIEHTSDVGFEVEEETLEKLFSSSALAMYGFMIDPFEIESILSRDVDIQSEDLESLMFDWMDELIFLFESEKIVFNKFDLIIEDFHMIGRCEGGVFDPLRHETGIVVKAVTYHMMEVKKRNGIWNTRVVLDV
ncbi:MAG: archease [Halobacteriota archaeon]|nr:archease [Halobacteriota archaeon]